MQFSEILTGQDAQGQTNRLFLFVLDEVGHVHGHSLNRSIVVLFNVAKHAPILLRHEVNGHTFATKSSTTTNSKEREKTIYILSNTISHRANKILPVDVVFTMVGQIVVDHEGNLLDVNTTSQEIGGDQDAG